MARHLTPAAAEFAMTYACVCGPLPLHPCVKVLMLLSRLGVGEQRISDIREIDLAVT